MLGLCKNKVFMFAVLGVTIRMLYTIGLFTFLIKILILKFGVDASKAGKTLGIIMVPSLIGEPFVKCLIIRSDIIEFS